MKQHKHWEMLRGSRKRSLVVGLLITTLLLIISPAANSKHNILSAAPRNKAYDSHWLLGRLSKINEDRASLGGTFESASAGGLILHATTRQLINVVSASAFLCRPPFQ